jgi:hypothetical protein
MNMLEQVIDELRYTTTFDFDPGVVVTRHNAPFILGEILHFVKYKTHGRLWPESKGGIAGSEPTTLRAYALMVNEANERVLTHMVASIEHAIGKTVNIQEEAMKRIAAVEESVALKPSIYEPDWDTPLIFPPVWKSTEQPLTEKGRGKRKPKVKRPSPLVEYPIDEGVLQEAIRTLESDYVDEQYDGAGSW